MPEPTVKTTFEKTFDNAADDYDRIRPDYAEAIYHDIFRYQPITPQSHVLEIGMGSGKASAPFLKTGCDLTALEPGEHLAAIASARYADCRNLTIHTQTLQDYECPDETYDLVYAATAFHWIPEEYGYKRVFRLLKQGGVFARFAYHAGPDLSRPALAEDIQKVYSRYKPQRSEARSNKPLLFGPEHAAALADLAAKYGFSDTVSHIYRTTRDFTAAEYRKLLTTYSDHMALEEPLRTRLFDGICEAIELHGGVITIHYVMDLELARKC